MSSCAHLKFSLMTNAQLPNPNHEHERREGYRPSDFSPKIVHVSLATVAGIYRAIEMMALCAMSSIYLIDHFSASSFVFSPLLGLMCAGTLFAALGIQMLGGYKANQLLYVGMAPINAFLASSLCSLFLYYSHIILGTKASLADISAFALTTALTIFIMRLINALLLNLWMLKGYFRKRIALVGGGENAANVIESLKIAGADLELIGIFDDRDDERSPKQVAGLNKIGPVDTLLSFARRVKVDMVLFTLPITAEERILHMLKKLSILPVDIRLSAHLQTLQYQKGTYNYLGPIPTLSLLEKPMQEWDYFVKTIFDRVIGLFALILLSPLMLLTIIAIKLDSSGPALFKQKRFGFNNELIEVYKFRSMYTHNADAKASKLVTKDDPRVTRVGKFIRKTSIDELPQLINVVFFGNLSLVGPRPHAEQAKAANQLYYEAVDGYFARHKVKPGITGWAQINGWRGETDTKEKIQKRFEHDLYYIENWSIWLDTSILLRTPIALLKTENAY